MTRKTRAREFRLQEYRSIVEFLNRNPSHSFNAIEDATTRLFVGITTPWSTWLSWERADVKPVARHSTAYRCRPPNCHDRCLAVFGEQGVDNDEEKARLAAQLDLWLMAVNGAGYCFRECTIPVSGGTFSVQTQCILDTGYQDPPPAKDPGGKGGLTKILDEWGKGISSWWNPPTEYEPFELKVDVSTRCTYFGMPDDADYKKEEEDSK